jgi:hypothetical protein
VQGAGAAGSSRPRGVVDLGSGEGDRVHVDRLGTAARRVSLPVSMIEDNRPLWVPSWTVACQPLRHSSPESCAVGSACSTRSGPSR